MSLTSLAQGHWNGPDTSIIKWQVPNSNQIKEKKNKNKKQHLLAYETEKSMGYIEIKVKPILMPKQ